MGLKSKGFILYCSSEVCVFYLYMKIKLKRMNKNMVFIRVERAVKYTAVYGLCRRPG